MKVILYFIVYLIFYFITKYLYTFYPTYLLLYPLPLLLKKKRAILLLLQFSQSISGIAYIHSNSSIINHPKAINETKYY